MDLISPEATYALLLAFGAFAIAVHAYGLYGTPLVQSASLPVPALLENVALPFLGGASSYNRGFVCYLVITEFLYLVLSSSSVILEMSLSVLGSEGTVGALNLHQPGSSLNPLTPVLASSVIMTAGEFKPFSQVENAIRRISHRVAGIPHNAYEALGRINSFRFDSRVQESPGRSVCAALELGAEVRASARRTGMNDDDADYLADSVVRIHALRAWTFGRDGERVWSVRSVAALRNELALIRPASKAFEQNLGAQLKASQAAPAGSASGTAILAGWKQLSSEAQDVKNDLATLFALLLINQPGVRIPDEATRIRALVRDVQQRDETQEINVLFGSIGIGLAIGLLLTTAYYLVARSEASLLPAIASWFANAEEIPGVDTASASLQRTIGTAWDDVVSFGLVFVVSTLVATSIRASRDSSMQWTYWSGRNLPIRQYLSVSVTSSFIAFLFFIVYNFWILVVHPSLTTEHLLVSPSLLRDFTRQYTHFILIPSIGLVCAWAVCRTLDRHEGRDHPGGRTRSSEARRALGHAASCGVLNALIRLDNGTLDRIGQALDALVVPALVLFPCFYLFAISYRRFLVRVSADELAASSSERGSASVSRAAAPSGRQGSAKAQARPVAGQVAAATARGRSVVPSIVCGVVIATASLPGVMSTARADVGAEPTVIRVGVRDDTKPFSYRGTTPDGEAVLSGYRGYMIEICRRVLRDMVSSGPFRDARIEPVVVDAENRFAQLSSKGVDLLCGPDSITSGRLRNYNVSHPLFISGMTYAYVDPNADVEPVPEESPNGSPAEFPRGFPRGVYCGNIVGVVRNTTAAVGGLRMMARDDALLRFDEALEIFLTLDPERLRRTTEAIRTNIREFRDGGFGPVDAPASYRDFKLEEDARIRSIQKELALRMKTEECPGGFTEGMPVRLFDDHDKGIDALCKGKVFYYLGDYDIIRTKISRRNECAKRVIIQRFTRTREVYGVFFRAGFVLPAPDAIEGDEACPKCDVHEDALLYAVFNHTLLRKMQSDARVLDVAYRLEFKDVEKSPDLLEFFESFEIASDLR